MQILNKISDFLSDRTRIGVYGNRYQSVPVDKIICMNTGDLRYRLIPAGIIHYLRVSSHLGCPRQLGGQSGSLFGPQNPCPDPLDGRISNFVSLFDLQRHFTNETPL